MVRTCIIGTGDHAYGLAHLFVTSNTESCGNELEVTKPGLELEGSDFHDTSVQLANFEDAIARADIIILAIPASALKPFVSKYSNELANSILVDATNSSVPGEDLHTAFAYSQTNIRWVKGLNDFGAVDVLLKKPEGKKKLATKMCSPDTMALETVRGFAEDSLGLDVKVVPFQHYTSIAQHQNSLGKEWMGATVIMIIVFILCQVYNILRYVTLRKRSTCGCTLLSLTFRLNVLQPSRWKRLSLV